MPRAPKAPLGRSASQRQPSLRGALMIDTLDGQLRVRKWPRARGKTRTKAQRKQEEWFAQVQRAANYVAPNMMLQFHEATQGTPLLPRDILTHILSGRAMMFVLTDGRKLYPMIFRTEVEEALDAITQTNGQILFRDDDGWRGMDYNPNGRGWWFSPPPANIFEPLSSDAVLPTATNDDDIGLAINWKGQSASGQTRLLMVPRPSAWTEWQLTVAHLQTAGSFALSGCGIIARNLNNGRDVRINLTNDEPRQDRVTRWNSINSFNGDYYFKPHRGNNGLSWQRFRFVGGVLYSQVSANGKQWITLHTQTLADWLQAQPTHLGLNARSSGNATLEGLLYQSVEHWNLERLNA